MPFRFYPLLLCLYIQTSWAQHDSTKISSRNYGPYGKDLIDVGEIILKKPIMKRDTAKKVAGKIYFSGAPSAGYSLSSGWAGLIAANWAFFSSVEKDAKISSIYSDALYTQQKQTVTHIQSNIFTKGNRFNIVNDWRYYNYPQKTYGLGMNTNLNNYANQSFNYLRLYQSVLKNIRPSLYAGLGYGLDFHWNVPVNPDGYFTVLNNINAYGIQNQSTSSGLMANILFDNRLNSINPSNGAYANVVYRNNLTVLGSNNNWQSLLVDLRKYYSFPLQSQNILAFWSYNWFTFSGNPPYLDLPSTGWDTYGNTGRGYIQGRFRGKNMVYLEAEYRFRITHNGLFGGVVFVNAQTFSEWPSGNFQSVAPAAGFGLRTKFNKYSRTNVAIDYGFGQGGSQGIFVNLGEVF